MPCIVEAVLTLTHRHDVKTVIVAAVLGFYNRQHDRMMTVCGRYWDGHGGC